MERSSIIIFLTAILSASIRFATPLIIATIGETFCERAGILNLSIEGTMIFGAFTGFIITYFTKNVYFGLIFSILCGSLIGILMGLLTINLGRSQHVSGLGMTIFTTGLSFFIYRLIFGSPTTPPTVLTLKNLSVPLLSKIPIIGNSFFNQSLLTYIAYILIPVSSYFLFKTTFGLNLRAVGENPESADSLGINVFKMRYIALIIGGSLMGLAGSFFSLVQFNMFQYGIVGGRGWICIALVIFAKWFPLRVFLGALLFGGIDALQLRLQAIGFFKFPFQIFLTLPYLLTIIILIIVSRNADYPSSILKPYRRE